MTTTKEKYNRLCDRNIIDPTKYDLNARIGLIIMEIQDQMKKWEQEAIEVYGPLNKPV